ncbi:MAG: alpha/beta fold hydrolase [Candidatus Peribacteria bacterium]|nr:MAG: alpha/beta fold hydrolase [Candidatus Peribacteria bacterium]
MAYLDRGVRDGPVILLLHGTPTNSWLWRYMVPLLLQQGYRVIAPDMLGFGRSEKVVNLDVLEPQLQAQRIIALMNYLDIDQWSVVAHDQ